MTIRTYFLIWAVLLALSAATVFVALLELGRFSIYTVILIAAVKSTLVLLFLLIVFLLVYFTVRYRRQRNPHPGEVRSNPWLDVAWIVLPTLLVVTMFFYGLTGFRFLRNPPEGAMVVKVIARQWSWRFEYANGFQTDKLIVPVDTPVEVQIVSEDVIHSFFVPAFRIKQDAVPGLTTRAWFSANVAGSYDILPHSSDGSALVGPTFKGLFGGPARIVQDGKTRTIVVDESYLRRHILDHDGEIVEGYPDVMPAFRGKITDQELDQIVQFIKSLR